MKYFPLYVSMIFILIGCGSGVDTHKSTTKPKELTTKVIAGDDQHVKIGDKVTLMASMNDHQLKIKHYKWREAGNILSQSEQLTLQNLSAGDHHFSVEAEDKFGRVFKDEVSVSIETKATQNHAPKAQDLTLNVAEDSSVSGSFIGSDSDGDSLSYILVSLPKHGTLTGSAVKFVYTPDANYNGEDSFLYKLNDGKIDSNLATYTLHVTPANDAPVAKDLSIETTDQNITPVTLNGEDIDGDKLTFIIINQPSHGTLAQQNEKILYTPQNGFSGSDFFTYKVSDSKADSNTATVQIDVAATNHTPIAYDKTYSTIQNQTLSAQLDAYDSDNDTLTFHIQQPSHGSVTLSNDTFTYTPQNDYLGSDSFNYFVNDGKRDSLTKTTTINVIKKPNTKPTVTNQNITIDEDNSVDITLQGNDSDGDPLTFAIVTQPSHGSYTIANNLVHYIPNADYFGEDSFTYKVNDTLIDSDSATLTLTINPVNDAPIASAGADKTMTQGEDITLDGSIASFDKDGNIITYTWKEGATVLSNSATISLSSLGVGTHTLTLEVTDNEGLSASDTVMVFVNANQTFTLIPKTAQTQSYYNNDDGYYQKGGARNFLRDDVNEIVTDLGTGLMWQDNSDVEVKKQWADADSYCQNSTLGGYTDWRLPQLQALYFLAKKDNTDVYESEFVHKTTDKYWSSDRNTQFHVATYVDFSDASESFTYTDSFFSFLSFTAKSEYVRCVRGVPLEFTFTRDTNTNMVTDDIHKLMWHDDTLAQTKKDSISQAIDYCENLDDGGYSDWRLPNIHELYSIVDPSKNNPAIYSTFMSSKDSKYWSSTASTDGKIYTINFGSGHEYKSDPTGSSYSSIYVRCVRDVN